MQIFPLDSYNGLGKKVWLQSVPHGKRNMSVAAKKPKVSSFNKFSEQLVTGKKVPRNFS